VEDASAHAAVRKQFGTPIGDFQAVAHPLADCSIRLAGATALARWAAFQLDAEGVAAARVDAAAAQLCAAEAAVEAVHVCHQVFGAIGITLEGPAFHVSRRILQLASQAPTRETARAALVEEFALTGRLRSAAAGTLSADGGMTR
jgi:alkylation response protein AidB-like acyl-CoA dehydrogenase